MKTHKKILYGCITGGYDKIPVHKYIAPDWDYVLFTDNKKLIKRGVYKHWTIKPLVFDKLDNVKNARWHKVNAHLLFPEYDYCLWLDSNIVITSDNIFKMLDKLIQQNVLVGVPNHPRRKCIYDEAEIIKENQIDFPDTVDKETDFLKKQKYPRNNGLSETNILLRKHNKIKSMLDLWWYMIETYSKRDQLSFNYALWKKKIKRMPIYTNPDGFGYHHFTEDISFVFSDNHTQDKIVSEKNKLKKKSKIINFFIRIIGLFIPIAKYRRRFKNKFLRDK